MLVWHFKKGTRIIYDNTDLEFTDLELEETTEGSVTFNRLVLSFSDNLAVNGGTVDKEDFSLIEDGNEYTLIPEVANVN